MRRLAVLLALSGLGCGSRPTAPAPQSINETVAHFLAAVKANDLTSMGGLWGSDRGPAAGWMKPDELKMRLTVIQKYLNHDGYRVVDGPLPVAGHDNQRTFHVELQRAACNVVQPLDLIRTRSGGWVVYDVHLESGSPTGRCRSSAPGTGP